MHASQPLSARRLEPLALVAAWVMRGGRRAGNGAGIPGGGGQDRVHSSVGAQQKPARPELGEQWPESQRTGAALPGCPTAVQGAGAQPPRSRSPDSHLWWCTQAWRFPKPKTPSGPSPVCSETSKGPFPKLNAQASFLSSVFTCGVVFPRHGFVCVEYLSSKLDHDL